ncbi:MAG: hypothetical protein EZS28_008281 [Streblomastix strix]|uniref:Uncharacterized protein n=1 Tax=Streblomastix strix TaxID=222440 RepID=A0A5J4WN34_9EUKA|nr:MAG: hypothetical protein EZS28_008281 [Streblomastix strix]
MQHSNYINGYMAMEQVTKTLSINPQSFSISKQQFFDQPIDSLTSSGHKYIRAPLAARGTASCSMVQTCQDNWTITLPKDTLAIQLNKASDTTVDSAPTANAAINFSGVANPVTKAADMLQGTQHYKIDEVLRFWIGFSTACGPLNQFAIYVKIIQSYGTHEFMQESKRVSVLESIVAGKRHCGVFIDVPLRAINTAVAKTPNYFIIPVDVTFCGVLDQNQLNPIFNSFPMLTRNYASLYLRLWMQDFMQDLKVVWLNKTDTVANNHLAYHMIPPEKPDIVYLMHESAADIINYDRFTIRIVNMQKAADGDDVPQNTISQIQNAIFNKLEIQNTGNSLQSIMSFANIKSLFMMLAMPQYPTWFFPVLFQGFDLIIDQRHVIPAPYEALIQIVNGSIRLQVNLTPLMHYLCDGIVWIMFDDNNDPQVLSVEVIGEMGGLMIRNG